MITSGAARPAPALKSTQISAVLQNVVAERDSDLAGHQGRVARLTASVAPALALPENEVPAVLQASYLHDVGKLAVPEALLSKPGHPNEKEWRVIRRHTLAGERILLDAGTLPLCAELVRSSHERFDGDGYPDGLSAEQIPLGARIIAVCDAYDAMTSARPYRRTVMSDRSAIAELRRSAGTQFDPAVVEALCALPPAERSEDGQ